MLLKSFMVLIPYITIQDTLPYVDNSPFRIQEEERFAESVDKERCQLVYSTPNRSAVWSVSLSPCLPVSLHNLLTHSINIGLHAAPLSPWLHNTFKF